MKPVILGAGLAGVTVALALAPMPVLLVSPRKLGEGCSTAWAQGGIAAAVGLDDTPSLHALDTLAAGNHLNDEAIVRQVTQNAPHLIEKLAAQGLNFDREDDGNFRLGLEAAHQRRRIVHACDATGEAIMRTLSAAVRSTPSIEVIEDAMLRALSVEESITGVTLQRGDDQLTYPTHHVVLATGGAAALWRDTTNPHENWGAGLAVAARAGAALGDLEFIQFHPTAIDTGQDPMPLASEALRGEGATLIDDTGARFVDELQPRDIVARAIHRQIAHQHRVYLDARLLGARFASRFPTIYKACLASGIDPTQTPIPVKPAAHYHMGGVLTDARGRTDVSGLWACGEVACTGLHGANRLASNSLLEAMNFGQVVAEDIKDRPPSLSRFIPPRLDHQHPALPPSAHASTIRAIMSDHVGVVRNREDLKRAIDLLSPLASHSDMALVGLMIAQSALRREESRGAHFRSDFPNSFTAPQRSRCRFADLKEIA